MLGIEVTVRGRLPNEAAVSPAFDREIQGELAQLGGIGQRLVVSGTPRGASGLLRGSILPELRGQPLARSVRVTSSAFYAPIVEVGRRPGKRPPVDALVLWVTRKLGINNAKQARSVAFLVARKIGARGYAGQHMYRRAFDQLLPLARTRFQALGQRLAAILRGGS